MTAIRQPPAAPSLAGRSRRLLSRTALTRERAGGSLDTVPRPFPAQTVRDLIGIARLLYRTWRTANGADSRLPELVAIGKDLQTAQTLAAASKPGTRRHREAWELAEVATHRLAGIPDAYVAVKPIVASTFNVVDETAEPTERDAKRVARQRR